MLNAIEISPKVWWVGGLDWSERHFHGYTTERGITYNAYLIMDETITLIDTAKSTFTDEFVQRISQVVDPAKIELVVTNHVEMDHSGSLPAIHRLAPNARIVASAPAGVNEIRAHYGIEAEGVKTGDSICIGERTLHFVQTPMVHWPDNMVTWCPEDGILFSNDAFGQHFATTKRFDDENDLCEVYKQAKKYYANIVWPYGAQVQKAMAALAGLDIRLIAPSHGVIWRSHIPEILEKYQAWSTYQTEEKAVVVFDSMWHSTEMMAREICDAFIKEGVTAQLIDVKHTHISDIMLYLCDARYVACGSPTLNFQHDAAHGELPHLSARPLAEERPAHRHRVRQLRLGAARPQAGVRRDGEHEVQHGVPGHRPAVDPQRGAAVRAAGHGGQDRRGRPGVRRVERIHDRERGRPQHAVGPFAM
ncbi:MULTISPECIES: FprA family A-type flavoprotein [Enorma]|uniref:FprA family A-type flavoprotein n=1 Tax=Enorma TaxID=1472762 RepID=UPI00034AF294|nr:MULTISPECIES: FprA family A-type flavoprotein [Enorma]